MNQPLKPAFKQWDPPFSWALDASGEVPPESRVLPVPFRHCPSILDRFGPVCGNNASARFVFDVGATEGVCALQPVVFSGPACTSWSYYTSTANVADPNSTILPFTINPQSLPPSTGASPLLVQAPYNVTLRYDPLSGSSLQLHISEDWSDDACTESRDGARLDEEMSRATATPRMSGHYLSCSATKSYDNENFVVSSDLDRDALPANNNTTTNNNNNNNKRAKEAADTDGDYKVAAARNRRDRNDVNRKRRYRWSPEEEKKLLSVIKKHGTQWAVVEMNMKNRSKCQCRERWRMLVKNGTVKEEEYLQKVKKD